MTRRWRTAGICICTILLCSLLVTCTAWHRVGETHYHHEEKQEEVEHTDSGEHTYQTKMVRTYLPRETLSLLQSETIWMQGETKYLAKDHYITKVLHDTLYVKDERGGTIVSEPPRSKLDSRVVMFLSVCVVVCGGYAVYKRKWG